MFKKLIAGFLFCPFVGTVLLVLQHFQVVRLGWVWIALPFVFQIALMSILLLIAIFAINIIKRIL
jgi:hypothetical protein